MQILLEALALFAAVVLQLAIAPHIAIAGVSPDIVFAVVVSLASFAGFTKGTAFGAGVGFLMDMLFLRPGHFLLQYTISGALAGLISIKKAARFLQPVIICLSVYCVKEAITLIILSTQGAQIDWALVPGRIAIGAIYTAAVSFIVYIAAGIIYRAVGIKQEKEIIFDESKRP